MSAPALVIRVEFEARPVVYVDALHDGDAHRVGLWLERSEDDLVRAAADLAAAVWERAS